MPQPVDPFAINQRLGRGVNILGYDPIWQSRAEGRMRDRHFRLIREAGFNHVRINLHPFKYMGEGPDYSIQPAWLETLDRALGCCLENELLAILDVHEFTTLSQAPFELKPQFLSVWQQLSTRYQDISENVLFETLNEPNTKLTPEIWNDYLKEPLNLVRTSHPTRTLILGPAFWNGIGSLHKLKLPENDRHIIVTVHYYHPMAFTHQGASWTPQYRHRSGMRWLGTRRQVQRLRRDFAGVQAWAEEHNRPIYLGEFGAYEVAEMESRARYTGALAREAERLGWSWAYWQFDTDFIVYDIDRDRWIEPVHNALIPRQ